MSDENIKIVIPEINAESGLNLCSGNMKLYLQSLRLFSSNIPATLIKLRGVTEETLKNYTTSVHSIKGMCDYIGAENIRKIAKQLEDFSDSGDYKSIIERNENFISQVEKLIENIKTWLLNNANGVK